MSDHPSLRLPAGMRDFAPRATAARRRIAEALLGVFEEWGFARVITPAFEYEDVLGLGLGSSGRAAALKFVEPSSGRVVALRPDITPQIARLIATRFRDETGPVRLCYEGTVLRLERGARSQRELIQAGVELAGVAAPAGDAEVIALGVAALTAAGLGARDFDLTIDLGHMGLMREVLGALELPDDAARDVRAAIAKRDRVGLDQALRVSVTGAGVFTDAGPSRGGSRAGARVVSPAILRFLHALPDLSGDPAVLDAAARQAPSPKIRRAISDLQAIVKAVAARSISARLHIDLAEVRGFDYYTGVRFQAFVAGSAVPVLQGGRYDDLLGRYGRPNPAVGFAVDVEAAAGALESAPQQADESPFGAVLDDGPVLVVGAAEHALPLVASLRAKGKRAAPLLVSMVDREITAYAARWGYGAIVYAGRSVGTKRASSRKKGQRKN